MLIAIENILGKNIMSLETGQVAARIDSAIINPHNLKIIAFYVSGPLVDFRPAVLFSEDIREFSEIGAIIDSGDKIMELNENMVRLKQIIDYGFEIQNIKVVDQNKHKIGRLKSYAVDIANFSIQQIFVRAGFWQSFLNTNLIIGTKQIIAIDNEKITIKNSTIKSETSHQTTTNLQQIENPFRQPKPASENIEKD